MHLHAVLFQLLFCRAGKRIVITRQKLVCRLDDAQALHPLQQTRFREFQPDCAATDDGNVAAPLFNRFANPLGILRRFECE